MVWAPKDSDLYEAFRAHLVRVLQVFPQDEHDLLAYPVPVTIARTGVGFVSFHDVLRPNWNIWVTERRAELGGLETLKPLLDALTANERVIQHVDYSHRRGNGAPLTPEEVTGYLELSIIHTFILNYLARVGCPVFDAGQFDAAYQPFEEWLLTDHHPLQAVAILHAFRGPQEAVELEEGIRIRRATDDDFTEIVKSVGKETLGIGHGKSLIEVTYRTEKSRGIDGWPGASTIENVLAAMRLTKKGGVYCNSVMTRRLGETLQRSRILLQAPPTAAVYELATGADIENLHQVWQFCRKSKLPEAVEFAVRRFNDSYVRWSDQDRLADLVIALESMFVPDSGAGEIGYKFRMRIAAMLGRDTDNASRKQLRSTAKLAYETRSTIVHGSRGHERLHRKLREIGLTNLRELCEGLEGYVRSAALMFIKEPQLLSAKAMDDILLGLGE